MWLKPPVWEDHVCEKPKITNVNMAQAYYNCYVDSIWRCDFCLKTYIAKEAHAKFSDGRKVLVWRSYQIGE